MSSTTTNFITLDNIAEIQDVIPGDFLFTVSNGVIYKLDFQNFVISLDNTDFAATIESLSSTALSLTQAFSSVNTVFREVSGFGGIVSEFQSSSATWNGTYETVNGLSAACWLPQQSVDKPILPGSMVYYDNKSPYASDWNIITPGGPNTVLTVNQSTGVPQFSQGAGGSLVSLSEGTGTIKLQENVNIKWRDNTYRKGNRDDADRGWKGTSQAALTFWFNTLSPDGDYKGNYTQRGNLKYGLNPDYLEVPIATIDGTTAYNNILVNYSFVKSGDWAGNVGDVNVDARLKVEIGDQITFPAESFVVLPNNRNEAGDIVPVNITVQYKATFFPWRDGSIGGIFGRGRSTIPGWILKNNIFTTDKYTIGGDRPTTSNNLTLNYQVQATAGDS